MEDLYMIYFKIAEIMGKHRVTKKQVSEATGIRPNTVSLLWHGTAKRLDVDHVEKLCEFFNCQPGDLLEYIPGEQK
ncbi:MAG: putative transcriptional regulator YozG, Cro/CI family [Neobacillus sp.]|nr:putative transcriptional regulator YozG, Cro/CI family [Neobacillus sp.]